MRLLLLIPFFFLMSSCSKPKTVLICGDHICINKAEAEQYFEDNLTLEVKVIDKKNGLIQFILNETEETNSKTMCI